MNAGSGRIVGRKYRWLPWATACAWLAFAAVGTIFNGYFAVERIDPLYVAALAIGFGLAGLASGYALAASVRRAPSLAAGAIFGHVALAAPAVQLGLLVATVAASVLNSGLVRIAAVPLFYATYSLSLLVSVTVTLTLGTVLGMALQAMLRAAPRPLAALAGPSLRLPSGWLVARVSILLAMLAGVALFADSIGRLPWPEAEPPSRSAWLEREKSLFRAVLGTHRYDAVVLPVKAEGPWFDRIERSLMTRYLSARVAQRSELRLPDPTLLARALGARTRVPDRDEARQLALAAGVGQVFETTVRRQGTSFSVRLARWLHEGGAWRQADSAAIEAIGVAANTAPSAAFRDQVDVLLDTLGLQRTTRMIPAPAPEGGARLPLNDLASLSQSEMATGTDRALYLQVFAALHTRDGIDAQTLWERSLIALRDVGGDTPLRRLLEARAYLHLGRRPYAMARLGAADTPAAEALQAALNGDVAGAEAAIGRIKDPALRLLSEIELVDLCEAYGLAACIRARREALIAQDAFDQDLIRLRVSADEWFSPEVHGIVSARLGYPGTGPEYLQRFATGWFLWLYWLHGSPYADGLRMASAIERGYERHWKAMAQSGKVRGESEERLTEADYYELLYAQNRAAALKTVQSTLLRQSLPRAADQLAELLYPTYLGHPYLTYLQSHALLDLGNRSPLGAHPRLFSRSSALALAAYRWEEGETPVARWAEELIIERPYRRFADDASGILGTEIFRDRLEVQLTRFTAKQLEKMIAQARRRLEFSDRDPAALEELVRTLGRAERWAETEEVIAQNAHRFVGSSIRTSLLASTLRRKGDREGIVALNRERLRFDPDSWEARWQLAQAHVENREFREAKELFLAYPGFAQDDPNQRVAMANRAAEAGRYLYRQGERQHAASLLRLSASLGTGAAREIHSRELLALIDDDLSAAAHHAQILIERYADSGAAPRYLLYLYLLGQESQAWEAFKSLHNRFGDEDPWLYAFVAHRIQGLDERSIEQWVVGSKSIDTRRDYLSAALRERHAFMLLFIDRPPSDAGLRAMQRITEAFNQSPFYPTLASAYVALRRGEYAKAIPGLKSTHEDLANISVNRKTSYDDVLPYLAFAYAASGQEAAAIQVLDAHMASIGEDADYLIGRALVDGVAGRHAAAVQELRLAFHRLPPVRTRSFYPGYVLLEACEFLLQRSGMEGYRELIEDFAPRLQAVLPYSWASAFEAKYTQFTDARQLALAAATILDPHSERISQYTAPERSSVRGAEHRHGSLLGSARRKPAR